MMGWVWLPRIQLVVLVCNVTMPAFALVCYHCNNVTSPQLCTAVTTCASGENCFTDGYEDETPNHASFNLGCRPTSECVKSHQQPDSTFIGKRSTVTVTMICGRCCGTDECNTHLCASDALENANSRECADDPSVDCLTISGLFNICADVLHAKKTCRKYCGLCEVAGNWSDWNTWSSCASTCGHSQKTRTRTCTNPPPANGGADCVGNATETDNCNTGEHCPVHGHWTNWSPWGICSVACGIGLERRDRSCSNPYPAYGGDYCLGDTRDDRHCFVKACTDGGWSSWSSWETCSASCDTGLTRRHRQCNNPTPSQFGKHCEGDANDSKLCFLTSCDVDGKWTSWPSWGSCSTSCGVGSRIRTRVCSSPTPSPHGQQCVGNHKETVLCHNSRPCPVDGYWSNWSQWSAIGLSCIRRRSCIGSYLGGKTCAGGTSQTNNNVQLCY